MRQAAAAAEAARCRATAANGSLNDLWGAAMATYEAARCTAAEVRTLQTLRIADVHAFVWLDMLCSACVCTNIATLACDALQPAVTRACQYLSGIAERSTDDAAAAHLSAATLLQSAVLRHTQLPALAALQGVVGPEADGKVDEQRLMQRLGVLQQRLRELLQVDSVPVESSGRFELQC